MSAPAATTAPGVAVLLRSLKLAGFVRAYGDVAAFAEREGWGFERYLHHLAEIEIEDRRCRRGERLLRQSNLPHDKTLATLELSRLPLPVRRSVPTYPGRRATRHPLGCFLPTRWPPAFYSITYEKGALSTRNSLACTVTRRTKKRSQTHGGGIMSPPIPRHS